MKSIKEKAEEYAFIKQGIDSAGIQFREFDTNKQDGFEAGANYVVEEIENLVKTTIGDGETYHYNLYIGLINLLEQLKK